MDSKIWSMSQRAGAGGALRALAMNVVNHLPLNRTMIKRMVAQVVAEQHGLGHIGDYKGHMYYVKSNLDLPAMIAQAKEAFDDMVEQKERQRKRALPQPPSAPAPSKRRGGRCGRSAARSTPATFQLDAPAGQSLTGVIIDKTHLPRHGEPNEILLQVPSSSLVTPAIRHSSPLTKCLAYMSYEAQAQRSGSALQRSRAATPAKPLQPGKKPSAKRQPQRRKSPIGRKRAAASVVALAPVLSQTARQDASSLRMLAGESQLLSLDGQPKPKPPIKRQRGRSKQGGRKNVPLLQRTYDKPWLVHRLKRRQRRAGGGQQSANYVRARPMKEEEPEQKPKPEEQQPKKKESLAKVKQRSSVSFAWYTPFQFQGATGAAQAPSWSKNKTKAKAKTKSKPKPKAKPKSKAKQYAANRRQRAKRLQAQLEKDLLREEAIDDPGRMIGGTSSGKRALPEGASWSPAPPLPPITPVITKASKKRTGSRSRTYSPTKVSERIKRLATPSPMRSGSPTQQHHQHHQQHQQQPQRRYRQRPCVIVGSSLGSMAETMQRDANNTSQSILTPAKRHLTIAFMGKRYDEGRAHGNVPWK